MFHTFWEPRRSRPAVRQTSRRTSLALQSLPHVFSPAEQHCVALNAHVAAVIRSLCCFLISVGRISARAPQVAPLSKSHGNFYARVRSRVRRASCISPGTDCVCTVCFAICCRSLLTTQRYFFRMCVCSLQSFSCCARSLCVSLLRCACARARPLSPAPMRPIQPCSALSISYACPRSRGVHAFFAQSVHEIYYSDLPFVSHVLCLCLQCASRRSAHRLSCSTRRPRCSGIHLFSMSALGLQCALLDLGCAPLDLHRAPLDLQCVSLDRQRVSLGLLRLLISLQRAPLELRQVLLELQHLLPDHPRDLLGPCRVSPDTARVSHDGSVSVRLGAQTGARITISSV